MSQGEYFKEFGFQTSRLVIVISWAKVWFFLTIICMNTYHFKGQLAILAWLCMPLFSTLPWTFLLVLNWIPDFISHSRMLSLTCVSPCNLSSFVNRIMCPLLNLSGTPRGVLEASRPIHFHIRHDMDTPLLLQVWWPFMPEIYRLNLKEYWPRVSFDDCSHWMEFQKAISVPGTQWKKEV